MGSEVGLGFLDLCRDADPEDQPHHCVRRVQFVVLKSGVVSVKLNDVVLKS